MVAGLLEQAHGGLLETELVVVETSGDKARQVPIHAIGGEGVFVAEVEAAVAEGRADAAVHSAKDLPATPRQGQQQLRLLAVPPRADPRDTLVGRPLAELAAGAVVATGSVRRRAQLAWLRPDLSFGELRGNIGTRLEKVPEGGAVVVARAALDRLGLSGRIAETLSTTTLLPQVGQGAIAVTGRPDDEEVARLLVAIEHPPSRRCLEAERAYLAELGGGCDQPVGGHARPLSDGSLALEAMIASLDGHVLVRERAEGDDPARLGRELARRLLDQCGGGQLVSSPPGL